VDHTPSEVSRYKMRPRDLIKVNIKTKTINGKHEPSREWVMHTKIYENTDTNAIVHCHSPSHLESQSHLDLRK
jgi:ribulose-5-phosphate 4-epimerase/fuculose-1-phosphate aldolase